MVDLHARPAPTQGATPLVKRCIVCGSSDGTKPRPAPCFARAYRQFLQVKVFKKDWSAELLSPSAAVDQMWRQHLLDNLNYAHDSRLLCCGHFVRHDPDGGLDATARKSRLMATRQALLETFGDEEGGELDQSATGPWTEVFETASTARTASAAAAAAAQESDDDGDTGAFVTIALISLTGKSTPWRVWHASPMRDVLREYARVEGVDASDFRFVFRGCRLDTDSTGTPDTLGIRSGDIIHVICFL
jgi:Ubiquitin-2 like Rad60 SUMO-like